MAAQRKVVVGITGASGSIYAQRLLAKLAAMQGVEVAVVCTASGEQVYAYELGEGALASIPFQRYGNGSFFAPCASGSAGYDTLIIAPCSMGTLGRIANGVSSDLLCRTADVMLKERRRLILVAREAPLNLIHLRNMVTVTEAGAVVCPASPSFYSHPATLEQLADTLVDRVLQLAGFEVDRYRWGG